MIVFSQPDRQETRKRLGRFVALAERAAAIREYRQRIAAQTKIATTRKLIRRSNRKSKPVGATLVAAQSKPVGAGLALARRTK
jgi:hypothetical protein